MPTEAVVSYPEMRDAVIIPKEQYEKIVAILRQFSIRANWIYDNDCNLYHWVGSLNHIVDEPFRYAQEALEGLEDG